MESGVVMEGNNADISVIIPVYNAQAYLERCLDSLVAQNMKNLEFVVVNNGSTDKSLEIIRDYASRDNRFVVLSQNNQGIKGSRNAGLRAARGRYITFVDADDYVDENFCLQLYSAICASDSDVAICDYTMTYRDHEEPNILGLCDEVVTTACLEPEMFYLRYIARDPVVWNKLYRRELLEESDVCFEVQHGEDMLFNLRLVPHIKQICTVSGSPYHYVQRFSSASRSHKKHLTERSMTILECFLSNGAQHPSKNMLFFAFSCIFTGFMFSTDCIGQNVSYFKGQIAAYREAPFFAEFCETISQTEDLSPIYLERVVTKRFYRIQKFLFTLCNKEHYTLAAYFMWICSKLITIKKRYFLRNYYE